MIDIAQYDSENYFSENYIVYADAICKKFCILSQMLHF